ncbi:MAG: hypothetical protein ACXVFF_17545 [Gaiellaceae bacterium]
MRRAAAWAATAALAAGAWPAVAAGDSMSGGSPGTPDAAATMPAAAGPDWGKIALVALAVGGGLHGVREVRFRRSARR